MHVELEAKPLIHRLYLDRGWQHLAKPLIWAWLQSNRVSGFQAKVAINPPLSFQLSGKYPYPPKPMTFSRQKVWIAVTCKDFIASPLYHILNSYLAPKRLPIIPSQWHPIGTPVTPGHNQNGLNAEELSSASVVKSSPGSRTL